MSKIKILFFHFDLGHGGAEKVMVNLLNSLDPEKYDITLYTLFHSGVNGKYLKPHIKWKYWLDRKPFRGVRHVTMLFSPTFLHRWMIKEKYDIEVAYYEGIPSRIVCGSPDKHARKYAWLHCIVIDGFFSPFRNMREVKKLYSRLDGVAGVSEMVTQTFKDYVDIPGLKVGTVHNTLEVDDILEKSKLPIDVNLDPNVVNLCSVGRLVGQKGFERLITALAEAKKAGLGNFHFYFVGEGVEEIPLKNLAAELGVLDQLTFLGYQTNPYRYVAKMDFFVCSSYKEGYSTAVTESLIVGTPVLTTDCSGMREMIGDTAAGIIVENSQEALNEGMKRILSDAQLRADSRIAAQKRSSFFSTESTLAEFENFIGTK